MYTFIIIKKIPSSKIRAEIPYLNTRALQCYRANDMVVSYAFFIVSVKCSSL